MAQYALGISERKLREMLPELPHVRRANTVMLPVRALQEWLDEQARAERQRAAMCADEIAAEIRGTRK